MLRKNTAQEKKYFKMSYIRNILPAFLKKRFVAGRQSTM